MGKNYKIAVLPGDGTGPEVVAEGLKVLAAAGKKFDFTIETTEFNWGGEHYLATGEILPDDAVETLKKFEAMVKGIFETLCNVYEKWGYEYFYEVSEEEMEDICEANGYEFLEDGTIF